uniref:Uncharacterized protein n=1 Tax=Pipistrellus kuhlii TaxID=59472 RepID=A0A7J7QVT1_PIPKU|nr:hypothetical protein mPipKuh1_008336 [Pipistrellus kuhlii]
MELWTGRGGPSAWPAPSHGPGASGGVRCPSELPRRRERLCPRLHHSPEPGLRCGSALTARAASALSVCPLVVSAPQRPVLLPVSGFAYQPFITQDQVTGTRWAGPANGCRPRGWGAQSFKWLLAGPSRVAQWIERWPAHRRVLGSIPAKGTCLGGELQLQQGACRRQLIHDSLSSLMFLTLFPFPFLSGINKNI